MAHRLRQAPQAARTAIADPQGALFATAVSGYELASKDRLGRLPGKLTGILPQVLRKGRISIHPLRLDHMIAAGLLPGPHRDPWNPLIMAQALLGELTVVTIDPVFRVYGVPIHW